MKRFRSQNSDVFNKTESKEILELAIQAYWDITRDDGGSGIKRCLSTMPVNRIVDVSLKRILTTRDCMETYLHNEGLLDLKRESHGTLFDQQFIKLYYTGVKQKPAYLPVVDFSFPETTNCY